MNYSIKHRLTEIAAGGALLYINKILSYHPRNDLNIYMPVKLESIFIEIVCPKSSSLLDVFTRSTSGRGLGIPGPCSKEICALIFKNQIFSFNDFLVSNTSVQLFVNISITLKYFPTKVYVF